MPTEAVIKAYVTAEGHQATNLWIIHEGKKYYSRVNFGMQDSPGMRNYCIQQFHARRKMYGTY